MSLILPPEVRSAGAVSGPSTGPRTSGAFTLLTPGVANLEWRTKKENVMQTPKIGTDEFVALVPTESSALYYKELASISEEIARLAVDMQHLSPNEREEVRLYLRRRSLKESAKQSGKITTVNELFSRLVQS